MVIFQIGFLTLTLIDLIDLLLVSWLFYKIYMYFKGTRAGQMLAGLIILAFWLTGLVTLAAPEPASDIALRVSEAEVDAPSADPL